MKTKVPYLLLLIGPTVLWVLGYGMNVAVIAANHGHMPVIGDTECLYHAAELRNDPIHVCLDKSSRLILFADWVYEPDGMASLGDICMHVYDGFALPCWFLWAGLMIKRENECPFAPVVTKISYLPYSARTKGTRRG